MDDYSYKNIKVSLQYAHKLMKGFGIVVFEYANKYKHETTQFFNEKAKVVATYNHLKKELWVWNKVLSEELEKLNY
jgi:hypothetical protein